MSNPANLADFATIPRDRWGRPMVTPEGGGKPVPHTRVSTLAKTLDDQTGLMKWKQRQTIIGVAKRVDLYTLAKSCGNNTQTLNEVAAQAMDAADSSAAANTGTALHSFCEAVDLGHDIDPPAQYAPEIAAYRKATEVLTVVLAERFCVNDQLQAAGSFDRLVRLPDGRTVIADIKTGKDAPRYATATAAQMAIYANSKLYNLGTGERTELPGPLDLTMGLLIHLPIGTGACHIHKVDLAFGWQLAQVAVEVRAMRKTKPATLAWSAEA
jgi:hypothetical protein